jgi:alpha-tubulin suppressor-like RCC1 family protein
MKIMDISCGLNTMLALTDGGEVFGWGRRMGVYPTIELTHSELEKKGHFYNSTEFHQLCPRLRENNLIFHKISSIKAAFMSQALITKEGELMVRGSNEFS